MNVTTIVILLAAFILLYGAIKNVSPLGAIKNALSQKSPSSATKLQQN